MQITKQAFHILQNILHMRSYIFLIQVINPSTFPFDTHFIIRDHCFRSNRVPDKNQSRVWTTPLKEGLEFEEHFAFMSHFTSPNTIKNYDKPLKEWENNLLGGNFND